MAVIGNENMGPMIDMNGVEVLLVVIQSVNEQRTACIVTETGNFNSYSIVRNSLSFECM